MIQLTDIEARVLGALMEKEVTTSEYYPLSLNALVNACNQKSNREPVMNVDEDAVRSAIAGLMEKGLGGSVSGVSRVTKYKHRLPDVFNLGRRESALLCVLLLRGPQTPGELRGRTERLHKFEELDEVEGTLNRLIEFDPPLVKRLPRQPGTKEARYAHLLCGDVEVAEVSAPPPPHSLDRVGQLEAAVSELQQQVADLQQQLAEFRKQFE